jgi:photosystem II stability/assembly factor-like uncharacterized protein
MMNSNQGVLRFLVILIIALSLFIGGCKIGDRDDGGNGNGNGGTEPPTPPVSSTNWQELGPAPISNGNTGRVSAIGVSAQNANLYYIGGADGGVWKTEDGGNTWTPLTDHMPTTAIGAIAVDPDNDQTVYAGTGEGNFANHSRYGLGLYKTADGGQNWQHLAADVFGGRCFSRLLIDPSNTSVLYASITHAGGLPSFDFNIAGARNHGGARLALGVWKSEDGGQTWQQLTNNLPGDLSATDLAMHPSNPSIIFAAIGHIFGDTRNGIYKSIDGGGNWTKLGGGLPVDGVGRIALTTTEANPGRLYANIVKACEADGGEGRTLGIYRSDDGGGSWALTYSGGIHSTYGWYLNVIIAHPNDAGLIFTGGLYIHRSSDGGGTWANVGNAIHVDFHALAYDAEGRLLAGCDGGVFRTANQGNSWTGLNNGLGIIQFYAGMSLDPDNPGTIYAGTQDNGTLKRTGTDKSSWSHILGGDGGCTAVNPDNPATVLAEYQGTGTIFKSNDYGMNFSRVNSGIDFRDSTCFVAPFSFDPNQSGTVYYATQRLYKSTSSGGNWQVLSSDLTGGGGAAIRGFAVAPSNSFTMYAGTNDGLVLVSFDGGASWDVSLTEVPGWPRIMRQFAIDSIDHLTAYLAVSSFGTDQVRVTRDGGQNWESLDNNLADIPVNTIAQDPRNTQHIYIGTDAGVYRSTNGGGSWQRFGEGLPNCPVNDMKIDAVNSHLIVATQGRGMWMIAIED